MTRKDDGDAWMWDGLAEMERADQADHIEELKRPRWIDGRAKPVRGILLHRLPTGNGYEVEMLFEERGHQ